MNERILGVNLILRFAPPSLIDTYGNVVNPLSYVTIIPQSNMKVNKRGRPRRGRYFRQQKIQSPLNAPHLMYLFVTVNLEHTKSNMFYL